MCIFHKKYWLCQNRIQVLRAQSFSSILRNSTQCLTRIIYPGLYLLEAVQTSSKFGKLLDTKVTSRGYRLLIVEKEVSQPVFFLSSDRKLLFTYMLLCWSKLLGEEIYHSLLVLCYTNIMFKFSVKHIGFIFFRYLFLNAVLQQSLGALQRWWNAIPFMVSLNFLL